MLVIILEQTYDHVHKRSAVQYGNSISYPNDDDDNDDGGDDDDRDNIHVYINRND